MRTVELLAHKRDGLPLRDEEIRAFVRGVTDGSIADEQAAAMLMAIRIQGMDAQETAALSMAMADSGERVDLSGIRGIKVDKHSTGGVGDTTTLIALPLAAACGVSIAKMSGRSLGHTGGTLDKLWAIPGMKVDLTIEQMVEQVNRIGCALIGQTGHLAPADKKLYALRDITATVDSLPLIASSILSKKIAAGCDAIVLDVKTGSGALLAQREEAMALAEIMVQIGRRAGRKISALVTDMSQPLGSHVGNALEVKEAIDMLAGQAQGPLLTLSEEIAAYMLMAAQAELAHGEALARVQHARRSGAAQAKLAELIKVQGGDERVVKDTTLLPTAPMQVAVLAPKGGYVAAMACDQIGLTAQALGAGRLRKEDAIDPAVGLVMQVRIGARVEAGQPLATLHAQNEHSAQNAAAMLIDAIQIGRERVEPPQLVCAVMEG